MTVRSYVPHAEQSRGREQISTLYMASVALLSAAIGRQWVLVSSWLSVPAHLILVKYYLGYKVPSYKFTPRG